MDLSFPPLVAYGNDSYPGRLRDLELLFGREYTQLSRLFGETIDFMIAEHKHVIEDNPGY